MSPNFCKMCYRVSELDWKRLPEHGTKDLKSSQVSSSLLVLSEWHRTSEIISSVVNIIRDFFVTNSDFADSDNLDILTQDLCTSCHERVGEMCRILADVRALVDRLAELKQIMEKGCKIDINELTTDYTTPEDEAVEDVGDTGFEDYADAEPTLVKVPDVSETDGSAATGCHDNDDLDYAAYKEKYKLKDLTVVLERLPVAQTTSSCSESQTAAHSASPSPTGSSCSESEDADSFEPRKPKKAKTVTAKRKYLNYCDIEGCKYRCRSAASLEAHKKQVHEGIPAPYVCPVCKKAFTARCHLQLHHRRVHLKEKRFTCELCGLSFALSGDLQQHKRNHSDVRNFPCPHCPQAFKKKNNFDRHIRSAHTGERPWICDRCGKGFVDSPKLKDHVEGVHVAKEDRRWYCQICGKRCASKRYVYMHIRNMHKLPGDEWKNAVGFRKTEEDQTSNLRNREAQICAEPVAENQVLNVPA